MIDLVEVAASAVETLGNSLLDAGKNALGAAGKAAGDKVAAWLKAKLTGPAESGALERFEADPESRGAKRMLEGAILDRLEQDESLVGELTALLKEAGDHSVTQTSSQTGDGNINVQSSGSGNQVSLGKRD